MIAMHLIPPDEGHRRWTIRFRNWDHRWAKIYAFEKKSQTVRFADRLQQLVDARVNGDAPPQSLQPWIDGLGDTKADRLTELGLLDRRTKMRGVPLGDHIDDWEALVAVRNSNTAQHGRTQAGRVRRIVEALHIERYEELNPSDVLVHLEELPINDNTRRGYLVALRDFCEWMRRDKRAGLNAFEYVALPRADGDPAFERRPLTPGEFARLLKAMDALQASPKARGQAQAAADGMVGDRSEDDVLAGGEYGATAERAAAAQGARCEAGG